MLHEAQPMREAVIECVQSIKSVCGKELPRLNALFKKILKRREEIVADSQYFPLVR